jgi:ubiquinone/menaquinone biosynthesis C-methylase UbiE
VRREFGREGFSDPGEAAAFAHLEPDLTASRVLDLGVGTGRTTALLAPAARSYTGVDLAPGMIKLARERHPGVDLRVADARDLRAFADASFELVVFSFNGLDAVRPAERLVVLSGIRRVLAPGGRALVSSLNLRGPAFGETPRTARSTSRPWRERSRSPRRYAGALFHRAQSERFFRRGIGEARTGDGWAVWPLAAHDFRFMVHFTDLGPMVRLLQDAGLVPERAWASEGNELDLAAETCAADYMHFLAGRPAA